MSASELYTPLLGSRSIRVLDIAAATDEHQDEIRCDMRMVSLSDKPQFAALSYVWGSYSSPPHTLLCGSHAVKVSSNCWTALWNLRRNFGSLTIWVDAVCMNQDDTKEKENQIPLMGDIYSMATSVYIWLGEASPGSDAAIDYLANAGFQEYLLKKRDLEGKYSSQLPGKLVCWKIAWMMFTRTFRGLKKHYRQHGCRGSFKAWREGIFAPPDDWIRPVDVKDFLAREWSNRVWTLQEFLLAANPVFCCGSKVLDWTSLALSINYLEISSSKFSIRIPEMECYRWRGLVILWFSLNLSSTPIQTQVKNTSISQATSHLHIFKIYSDSIHKAIKYYRRIWYSFAALFMICLIGDCLLVLVESAQLRVGLVYIPFFILGLMVMLPFPSRNAQLTMFEDVNTSEAMIQEIRTRRSTNPKDNSYGMHSVLERLGLPVTSPDYSRQLDDISRELFIALVQWTQSLNLLLCASNSSHDPERQTSWIPDWQANPDDLWLGPMELFARNGWDATPSSSALWTVRFHNGQHQLLVRGRKFGEISWRGDAFVPISESYVESERQQYAHNLAIAQTMCSKFWDRASPGHERGWIVPLGKNYFLSSRGYEGDQSRRHGCWTQWMEMIIRMARKPTSEAVEYMRKCTPRMMKFYAQLCNDLAAKKRTVFLASTGAAPGNCPASAQVGDTIALVSGVSMPLVLREEKGCYRLIGFAVMEAANKGQLWKDVVEDELEEMVLC